MDPETEFLKFVAKFSKRPLILRKRSCLRGCQKYQAGITLLSNRGVAQPGSAPALGAGGRRFKSALPDHPLGLHEKDF